MNILFRVDASLKIGAGHVKRCLNLAKELSMLGAKCVFACQTAPGNLIDEISRNYTVLKITSNNSHFNWREDIEATTTAIANLDFSTIIVDHYEIDYRWHKKIKNNCKQIVVIDDLANREHDCNILIDSNVGRKKNDYHALTPTSCKLLIGSEYLLLDPICYTKNKRERKGSIIFLGGGDNEIDLKNLISISSELELMQPITCVISEKQSNKELLIKLCEQQKIDILINPINFKEICQQSSLGIVRCGLISYELAMFQTPNVCIYQQGIHETVAKFLEQKEYCSAINVNSMTQVDTVNEHIKQAIHMTPKEVLQKVSGTSNVAQHII